MALTITATTASEADAAWRMAVSALDTLPADGVRFLASGDDRPVLMRRDDTGRLQLKRLG